jgi:hypothetical protein
MDHYDEEWKNTSQKWMIEEKSQFGGTPQQAYFRTRMLSASSLRHFSSYQKGRSPLFSKALILTVGMSQTPQVTQWAYRDGPGV